MIDIDALKSSINIEEVIGRFVKLTRKGAEFHGLCPFHDEKTPSFTVYKGSRFHCFGCGEKGDVIDFVCKVRKCNLNEALEYLGAEKKYDVPPPEKRDGSKASPEYRSIAPTSNDPAPPLPASKTATIYPYLDADGYILSYVVRDIDAETGKKIFRGLSFGSTGNEPPKWTWKHPTVPRHMYGLDRLASRPDAPVMVCEGEKAAEAAQAMFPAYVAMTWAGGSSAVKNTDWSPLADRRVIIWPDADEPGAKAARAILEILPQSIIVDTAGLPQAFDAADLITDDPKHWLDMRLPQHVDEPPEYDYDDMMDEPFEAPKPRSIAPENIPIKVIPLGYDRDRFYYFSTHKRMISELAANEHSRANLCGLASASKYWEVEFQQFFSKQGFSWPQLADHLMDCCRERGVYDPAFIRGRGAWIEGNVPILHIGDALIINGERHPLTYPGSRYIYEADVALLRDIAEPLETKEAHWLAKVCKLLRWETPANGTLLAGWLAIAPICGALQWRPSVWLTGGSGAGKTWVMDNIVNVCLSEIALYVAFNTTEPGIRQALQSDARPVVFDEAERDSTSSAFRMDEILGYQRVASSENSVQILKGDNSGGRAKSYKPRSCFLFQSINTGITKKSDESRVTILSLRDHSRAGDISFEDLEAVSSERITSEFAARLISRSVSLIPAIRANARTFARAVAEHLKSRRFGDQLGTLLSGAYSLHSTDIITYEKALEIVAREEWTDQAPQEDEKDEYRLLRTLLAARVKCGTSEMPISRLIEAAQQWQTVEGLPSADIAQRIISENGIKMGTHDNIQGLFFSTNHPALKRLLRGTEWEASWSRSLGRITGAIGGKDIISRFALGHQSRATFIPMTIVDPK